MALMWEESGTLHCLATLILTPVGNCTDRRCDLYSTFTPTLDKLDTAKPAKTLPTVRLKIVTANSEVS